MCATGGEAGRAAEKRRVSFGRLRKKKLAVQKGSSTGSADGVADKLNVPRKATDNDEEDVNVPLLDAGSTKPLSAALPPGAPNAAPLRSSQSPPNAAPPPKGKPLAEKHLSGFAMDRGMTDDAVLDWWKRTSGLHTVKVRHVVAQAHL